MDPSPLRELLVKLVRSDNPCEPAHRVMQDAYQPLAIQVAIVSKHLKRLGIIPSGAQVPHACMREIEYAIECMIEEALSTHTKPRT